MDIIPRGVNPVINCSQRDEGRLAKIYLTEDGDAYELTGQETLTLYVDNGDEIISKEITNSGSNLIEIELDTEITSKSYKNYCKIGIEDEANTIYTSAFYIAVEKAP